MREIAARYPITYRRVGEKIEALGYDHLSSHRRLIFTQR